MMARFARAATDTTGNICFDADYRAGARPERSRRGTEHDFIDTCPQNYKFTGKERDPESNLDYFGARYYASQYARPDAFTDTGRSALSKSDRFMSPDWSKNPEGVPYADYSNPQSLNLYNYTLDNPETNTDSNGHWCILGVGSSCGDGFHRPPVRPPAPKQKMSTKPAIAPAQRARPENSLSPFSAFFNSFFSKAHGKGERRLTGRPENPGKHARWDPEKKRWWVKDPQTGKRVYKPTGWSPQTTMKVGIGAALGAAARAVIAGGEACTESGLCEATIP